MTVVLFDLDDTLYDHHGAVAAGITAHRHAIAGALGQADDAMELSRWRDLEELHYHRYLAGELDYTGQRRARARGFVAPFAIDLSDDSAADEWFSGYFAHYKQAPSLHEDAMACLDLLASAGHHIGIITNGELAVQSAKIQRVGLTERIEHLVASGAVGVAKPDSRIFVLACDLFGAGPSEAVYVGDRLATDALGAVGAGLRGIWIARSGVTTTAERAEAEASGVAVIRSLSELPALLL